MQPDLLHDMSATSFGGVPCAQIWIDFILWENVLNANPQCRAIVEIGTWKGGFSHFLYAQARARGMRFHTFDAVDPSREIPGFEKLDCWSPVGLERISKLLGGLDGRVPAREDAEPVVLFCDGGNKPRELETFPPMCPPGSVFLVHDWGTETLPTDVPDGLTEMYGDWCDTVGSMTRVFKHGS